MTLHVNSPPPTEGLFERYQTGAQLLDAMVAIRDHPPSEYLHWDKLRHLTPPAGLTHDLWWLGLKVSRGSSLRRLPLDDLRGRPFVYGLPDEVLRAVHFIDQRCAGEIAMPEIVTADEQAKRHYLVNSLMEEAIRSSQLEGATTSRKVAKELLRTGRPPKNRSERMILNNYRALQFMRDEIGAELTPEVVLELQRILTEGTLDNPDGAGRLQAPGDDRVAVFSRVTGELLHQPPPAAELPTRLAAMCEFANGANDPDQFMHPAVRAIVLHFWLAYDHPFEDGNGRAARALFYWSMRNQGYWLVEYLPISRILRDAPSQYARAFRLTETDENDVTYFLIYQLGVIERAVREFHKYLQRKVAEVREVERLMRQTDGFNHRQLALLSDAMRNPDRVYTYNSHAASHHVTHETARQDLLGLSEEGLFERRRSGRRHAFAPAANLPQLLKRIA